MSTDRMHECQSRLRRKYATQPHCPQDAQRQVAVPVTQWARQNDGILRVVASSKVFRHVVQAYTKPQCTPRSKMHIPGIDDLPGAALRRASPPTARDANNAQHTHPLYRAVSQEQSRGAVTFCCAFIASSSLKFRLTQNCRLTKSASRRDETSSLG